MTDVKECISWHAVRAFQCTKCSEVRETLVKLKAHYFFGHQIEVLTPKEFEGTKQN